VIVAWLVGLALGFLGSMPIAGPTAVVLVSKGLENQVRPGVFIAIGAAVAESAYAFMAFWGLTEALQAFPVLLPASRFVGGVLLFALGVYFALRKPTEQRPQRQEPPRASFGNVLFGLSLTAVNPTLVVTWTAAVGAAHSTGLVRVNPIDAFPFAGGVACGIVSWFALMLWLLSRWRSRVQPKTIDRTIRWMGFVLIAAGAVLAGRALLAWP